MRIVVAKHRTDPEGALRDVELLAGLSDKTIRDLARRVRWVQLKPGERLPASRSPESTYYFVAKGELGLIIDGHIDDGEQEATGVGAKWQQDVTYLARFNTGDFFADGLPEARSNPGINLRIRCQAVHHSHLAGIPSDIVARLMARFPDWGRALHERNAALRKTYVEQRVPARRLAQDFYLRQGYSYASTIKVIDLQRCMRCDACEKACTDRHGVSRLVRQGPSLGRIGFPNSCRACKEPNCLHACAFGAITLSGDNRPLLNSRACVGCSACLDSCPNGVVEMVETPYTVEDFPKPMPWTNGAGLTNIADLYLVGEASGTALIKLAINAGRTAVEEIIAKSKPSTPHRADFEVLVVGAGPAGLSAALTCQERGLDFGLFDKGDFATTIQNYPKNKIVMAEPAHIPLYGNLWLQNTTKEELIERWRDVIATTGLQIRDNEEVIKVHRTADDLFEVDTVKGRYTAQNVVMAPGTRGSPRKLGVAGETHPRVRYVLTDPGAFADKRVLVVGGGDSAVEAAMSVADAPGARVTLSYRRHAFGRIKAANATRLTDYEAEGRVEVVLSSTVSSLNDGVATLNTSDGERSIPNDVVFALLGAEPPTGFFESAGIEILEPGTRGMAELAASRGSRRFANKCDQCDGYNDQACISACPTHAIMEAQPEKIFRIEPDVDNAEVLDIEPFVEGFDASTLAGGLIRWMPYLVGTGLLATIAFGVELFLRRTAPEMSLLSLWRSPTNIDYVSGRGLGHQLGYIGTTLMLLAVLYPLRSRTRWLDWAGSKKLWMSFHILFGTIGPAFVLYHSALKLDRWPSLSMLAMGLVFVSGALGRYVDTWASKQIALADFELRALESTRQRLFEKWHGISGRTVIFNNDASWASLANADAGRMVLIAPIWLLMHRLVTTLRLTWLGFTARRTCPDPDLRHMTLSAFRANARIARRRVGLDVLQRSVRLWRWIHTTLTAIMFAIAAAHIVLSLMYRGAG